MPELEVSGEILPSPRLLVMRTLRINDLKDFLCLFSIGFCAFMAEVDESTLESEVDLQLPMSQRL